MNQKNYRHYIAGERIYLRPVCREDVNENYRSWMNDPDVVQYLESRFRAYTIEDLIAYVDKVSADPDMVFMAIVVKSGDIHIGNVKLGPINRVHRVADMGIIIGERDHWGQGYATEAIQLMVRYAFDQLNLHKVTAGIYANNTGSEKAFLKAGFQQEGLLRQQYLYEEKYIDAGIYGIINPRG
jgi:RimJ/RimL family protein N-acetyltransferase